MTKQIAKPYFRDWSNMRFHKGKVFVANERLFRADAALYFPNFVGKTLKKGAVRSGRKDGFGGLGRDTCEIMSGKVSVVSLVGNAWAEAQAATFCGPEKNPALHEVLRENEELVQRVEINYENNYLKYWILMFFGTPQLRKCRTVEEQGRYFIVRRGMSDIVKESIGFLNEKGGYVYLVDCEGKIRWAGSAEAEERERESLVKGVTRLITEFKTPKKELLNAVERKNSLTAAVIEITEEDAMSEKPAAIGSGG